LKNALRPKERAAIKRGAALLDTADPKWFRKLNPANFDLGDEKMCVLGQAYGDYFKGLNELAAEGIAKMFKSSTDEPLAVTGKLDGRHYGFNTHAGNAAFERMGQEWIRQVIVRRKRARRAATRG
jgi:hypothetical protein